MPPRNSNRVSEANVSRYIAKSLIEPFGVIGIPPITMHVNMDDLLDTMFKYSDVKSEVDQQCRYFENMVRQVCTHHHITMPYIWYSDRTVDEHGRSLGITISVIRERASPKIYRVGCAFSKSSRNRPR